MAIGIVVIGAVVYGALWAFTTWLGDDPDTASAASTSTTAAVDAATTAVSSPPETATSAPDTTSTTATDGPPSTTGLREPSEITVLVLNAVGTDGMAAELTTSLAEMGYNTLEPDNYGEELDQSVIIFQQGFGPEAFELAAAAVLDAEVSLNPDPDQPDIVVVLGRSFDG
jgi:hypothetical protein